MTREEAIELLRELWNFLATPPEIDEAVNMAIEALQQQRQEILPKHCIVPPSDASSSAKPYKIGYRNRTNGE